MEVHTLDLSKVNQNPGMVKSQSVGTISSLQKEGAQRRLLIDRGVGSHKLVKSSSSISLTTDRSLDTDTKVCINDSHFLFLNQIYFQWTNLYCIILSIEEVYK